LVAGIAKCLEPALRQAGGTHGLLIPTRRDEERILDRSLRLRMNEAGIEKSRAPGGSTRRVDAAESGHVEVP